MVTVSLLTFIVLGLLLMFNQTQRAFRTTMTQSDVLETARSTMDLMSRDLEGMAPCTYPDMVVNGRLVRTTNFMAEIQLPPQNWLVQPLPGNTWPRTNLLERFFFQTKLNQDWIGIGYQVMPDDNNGFVGTLYRYCGTNTARFGINSLSQQFLLAAQKAIQTLGTPGMSIANMNRVADGVVHLQVRPYAPNGFPIVGDPSTIYGIYRTNAISPFYGALAQVAVTANNLYPDRVAGCYFVSNAVPAYVELELGILEPQVLKTYRNIPVPAAQVQYLTNHVAQVHLFRQRIPIRNVDPTAYP